MGEAVSEKVGRVIASINGSKYVDQVISAVYSLAALIFPLDSLSFIGGIGEKYRDEVRGVEGLSENQRKECWRDFYQGAAFPALARVLLYDVASEWLACFPNSARKNVYDVFFVKGHMTEVVQTIVPCLQHKGSGSYDITAVHSNAERLLVLCLVENDGAYQMVKEFNFPCENGEHTGEKLKQTISWVAQLVSSIPDKAQLGVSTSLSSHSFFKSITAQLLAGAEEWDKNLPDGADSCNKMDADSTILFVGEIFARICRRGSADVLLSEVIPRILCEVRNLLSGTANVTISETFELKPGLRFWSKVIEEIKDSYAVERMSEQLLRQLAAQNLSDIEAYWLLWILFHQIYKKHSVIRSMFVDKFLLWKVFPICCLRWILHFAVLECAPDNILLAKAYGARGLSDAMQRLVSVWSKREFVQSTRLEQQAYVTAALGLCLEKMSKEDLDAIKDAIHSILQGVSCRLESPDYLVRKMASSIALVFSRVVDPQNPLYLDDSCCDEIIDWEFGTPMSDRSSAGKSCHKDEVADQGKVLAVLSVKESNGINDSDRSKKVQGTKKKLSELKLVDPDEVIDPAALNGETTSDGEDGDFASQDSDSLSDTSLQPYDLTDDDADLKRKFSQLVDVVGALRKSDDVDGVEGALDVAEKLVRASPDELKYVASDLFRSLVQVRCSDLTVEGEESAEEKRQKALVALIVTCPLESLEALHNLLYSPTLDVSQRIMILDVMTGAAQELASRKFLKPEYRPRNLISSISDQPWFIPRSIGPPGASYWKEISTPGNPLNWSYSYERELPPKPGKINRGKTRRWSLLSSVKENQLQTQNEFPQYAAAFMLPAMQNFNKKRHGVDLLGQDFIVLGKVIYMLGICIKCAALHPEACVLASLLLDMLRIREISHHTEPYVRRSVLFAASCVLVALHPTHVASALVAGNTEIPKGLEWIRTWAHHIIDSDTDRECYMLAVTCLQLHSEMALQASRALESTEGSFGAHNLGLPSSVAKEMIKIPSRNFEL
ncbi:hypothetical protein ACH5RR_008773 [Cinchona calisaya]|uniref:Telomere length regulation protein conserved domain-containing protein n=1 Tax=Cinchona calisaya TaxID=153742 RepID=A0ABD3AET0_9GENT